jgi:hypothetical protein
MSKIGCAAISYGPEIGSALFVSDYAAAANILYFPVHSSAEATKLGLPSATPSQAHDMVGSWYLSSDRF